MTKFSKQNLEQMFENNVRFDKILHIASLCASRNDRISDDFQDFLDAASEKRQNDFLLEQCPQMVETLKEIRENESIVDFSHDVARDLTLESGEFEFLVLTETASPRNFVFKENGEFESCSTGGWYTMQWILAKDMTHAAEVAIEQAKADWNEEMEAAKAEQGIVTA